MALTAMSLQLSVWPAFSQGPGAGAAGAGGPIDIQADEQEFAEGHVVAKGRVKVTYKDSVVFAPTATLYRDAGGSPQRAVFTGHPHLIQGANKIDAETLVFEIGSQKIIADRNAHSEVLQAQSLDGPDEKDAKDKDAKDGKETKDKTKDSKDAKGKGKNGSAKTPAATTSPTAQVPEKKNEDASVNEMADASTTSDTTESMDKLMAAPPSSPAGKKAAAPGKAPPEKIITDSDHQEYTRSTGKFTADGHVHVHHGDVIVTSDHLQLVYGSDRKPETALFTGKVSATQNENNTQADTMTYFLNTQRLQATGNVKSKVIQKKADGAKKGGPSDGTQSTSAESADGSKSGPGEKIKVAGEIKDKTKAAPTGFSFDLDNGNGDPIFLNSDAQDYIKETGRITALGNVHVYYGDTTGIGPNVVLIRNAEGAAERVIFTGRSQILQPGKRWIGDKITMTVNDRKVLAQGNTRAYILQTPGKDGKPANSGMNMPGFGTGKRAPTRLPDDQQVAAKKVQQASTETPSQSKISTSKVEGTQ